jgi:CMP-N,N'-diacetyllegionaminic acid synthase
MKILCIIPARSGSKGIVNKNIRPLLGKPLMAWSIEHALASSLIDRVIVSTDSEVYADVAKKYGAEVPFLRPAEISQDFSTDYECFRHALEWLNVNEGYNPDYVVHLWPTCPIRSVNLVDTVIERLLAAPEADSIRTLTIAQKSPFKMWFKNSDSPRITPVAKHPNGYGFDMPRQLLPQVYVQNANVQVFRSVNVTKTNSIAGDYVLGFETENFYDIDDESDWTAVEQTLANSTWNPATFDLIGEGESQVTFCFDVDGIIATLDPNNNYRNAGPIHETIEAINSLFRAGFRIVINTARGDKTGIDWKDLTRSQLEEWGVRFHELRFSKPAAHVYVDDKFWPLTSVLNFAAAIAKPLKETAE